MNKLTLEQKYDYYERSVQNAEGEVEFMDNEYRRINGRAPISMREDFCGTGAISCSWVQLGNKNQAYGIDLDPEPLSIGMNRHFSKLTTPQKKRMVYLNQNVLTTKAPKVDVICAFNFSYFIFKTRKELLNYFKSVRKSLNKNGVFFLDIFAGPESQKTITDIKKLKDITYYWECQFFNPLTHDCTFAIHFKDPKGKKHKNVFTYNWRMWMMPELRDILADAGFSRTVVYWEGDGEDGSGDGIFAPTEITENCDAWVSYIAAIA